MYVYVFFFFFKQTTEYEMRISDWSSDVCSSDLPLTVQQFRGSPANPAFLLHAPGRSYVLRKRTQAKKGLDIAASAARDFTLISSLHAAELPVAAPRLVCPDDSVIGAPFYLMDHVPGRHFRDPNLPGMDAKQRHALYDAMAAALAQIHALVPDRTGLPADRKSTRLNSSH